MHKTRKLIADIALAACASRLEVDANGFARVQVFPAGRFHPSDGRKMTTDGWYIDQAIATQVIEKFRARKTPPVVDYEHQTLRAQENGQPAPAAAWFQDMEWVDGKGLYGTLKLTAAAHQAVDADEYLYFSPVHRYDPRNGNVVELVMGALTNNPAIDGMEQLTLLAAATYGANLEDHTVDLLQQLLAKLGLSEGTTEEQAIAALSARLDADPLTDVRKALGEKDDADAATVVAACTALKTKASNAEPDPSKFVPVSALNSLKTELAALTAQFQEQEKSRVDDMIKEALDDGRLTKGMESWARSLADKDVAALTAYLESAEPIAALRGSQTNGNRPDPDEKTGLTQDELAVCSRMGINPDDFKKTKAATSA